MFQNTLPFSTCGTLFNKLFFYYLTASVIIARNCQQRSYLSTLSLGNGCQWANIVCTHTKPFQVGSECGPRPTFLQILVGTTKLHLVLSSDSISDKCLKFKMNIVSILHSLKHTHHLVICFFSACHFGVTGYQKCQILCQYRQVLTSRKLSYGNLTVMFYLETGYKIAYILHKQEKCSKDHFLYIHLEENTGGFESDFQNFQACIMPNPHNSQRELRFLHFCKPIHTEKGSTVFQCRAFFQTLYQRWRSGH